jgi:alpha-tubulin suppressor-like RCC1 family protein
MFGALGDGTGEAHSPVPVTGMDEATSVAVGGSTVFAVRPTGAAYGWGDNLFGQLGMGDLLNRFIPERLLFCDPSVPWTCAF